MNQLPPEAMAALARGETVEAIRIVRERTGLDLKESKALVDRYLGGLAIDDADIPDAREAMVPRAALDALANGNKVEAIRLTREATGLGLAESKRLVEDEAAGVDDHTGYGAMLDPMAEPGRVQGAGSGKWVLIAMVLIAAVVAWFWLGRQG
ncbi:MAG: hypothetical protein EOP81_17735 [Variovorax sp.]|nr:MAG: hypothetical protein EOP81_17735 [Variovorax sp.]